MRKGLVHDPVLWALMWLFTRLGMLAEFQWVSPNVSGDVGYYWTHVGAIRETGIGVQLREYPTPVVWGLQALHALYPLWSHYQWAFVGCMALLDALMAVGLWRSGHRHRLRAVAFWIAFLPLIGCILLFRFDVLPAVLAGGALLLARRRPAMAGALIGLGAGTKLWPALLLLPLLAAPRRRRATLAGFGVVGVGLAVLSLLTAGWTRTASPLSFQSRRGLQIESIAASWPVLGRFFHDGVHTVTFSQFNAFEMVGPSVRGLLLATTIATAAGLVVIVALCWRLWRAHDPRRDAAVLAMLAIVGIMLITNKTLSPQYLVWLGGPAAVGLLLHDDLGGSRARRRLIAGSLLVIAVLTHLVYPLWYQGLVYDPTGQALPVAALLLRNGLLVGFTVACTWWAWLAAGDRRPAVDAPPA